MHDDVSYRQRVLAEAVRSTQHSCQHVVNLPTAHAFSPLVRMSPWFLRIDSQVPCMYFIDTRIRTLRWVQEGGHALLWFT